MPAALVTGSYLVTTHSGIDPGILILGLTQDFISADCASCICNQALSVLMQFRLWVPSCLRPSVNCCLLNWTTKIWHNVESLDWKQNVANLKILARQSRETVFGSCADFCILRHALQICFACPYYEATKILDQGQFAKLFWKWCWSIWRKLYH